MGLKTVRSIKHKVKTTAVNSVLCTLYYLLVFNGLMMVISLKRSKSLLLAVYIPWILLSSIVAIRKRSNTDWDLVLC